MKTQNSLPQGLPISHPTPQDQGTQNKGKPIHIDELIFTGSCLIIVIILQLPMEYVDGKPVPTVVFKGHASIFQAFLIFLMGSCYGSVCSIHVRERMPKVGRFYSFLGVACTVVCFAIFSWLAVPAGFMWMLSRFC